MERESCPLNIGSRRWRKGLMIFQGRFRLWMPGFGEIAITNHGSVADQIKEVFLNSITPSVEMVSLMLGERIICSP